MAVSRRGLFGWLAAAPVSAAVAPTVIASAAKARPCLSNNEMRSFVAEVIASDLDWPSADRVAARLNVGDTVVMPDLNGVTRQWRITKSFTSP